MIDLPLRRGATAALLLVVWLATPVAGVAQQAAQAVRVSHDSGGPPAGAATGSGEHRYGPPESVRQRDAQLEASVPTQYAPPAGMCRVWVGGVPPGRQPAPTECAKAVRVQSPNSHIVFGKATPSPVGGSPAGRPAAPSMSASGGAEVTAADHGRPAGDVHGAPGPVVGAESNAPSSPASAAPGASPSAVHPPAPAPSTARVPSHPVSHPHSSPPPHVTARPRR
jgi:hypothetical protein